MTVKAYPEIEDIVIQLVELHHHHVNSAEPAIQTFKTSLVSGMYMTDDKLHLCCGIS